MTKNKELWCISQFQFKVISFPVQINLGHVSTYGSGFPAILAADEILHFWFVNDLGGPIFS